MTAATYYRQLKTALAREANEDIAHQQRQYMRNQFDYYGLHAPRWLSVIKAHIHEHDLIPPQLLPGFIELCFDDPFRELQYAAIEITQRLQKKLGPHAIELIETMILEKSWWDTVDWLAKLAGIHFKIYPQDKAPITRRWMDSQNMWLQRSAVIFQLLYRYDTDFKLMTRYILELNSSPEFFIQKACGWALRQYSKYEAQAVIDFVENHRLPPLTYREAFKWVNKNLK